MNGPLPMLAELDPNDQVLRLKSWSSSGWSQIGLIFGSIAAVALLSFLAVYCFRKQILGRHKRRHHRHRSATMVAAPAQSPAADEGRVRKRGKWRRLRRLHRPLNPTLAETRGLPPLRDERPPPAS